MYYWFVLSRNANLLTEGIFDVRSVCNGNFIGNKRDDHILVLFSIVYVRETVHVHHLGDY